MVRVIVMIRVTVHVKLPVLSWNVKHQLSVNSIVVGIVMVRVTVMILEQEMDSILHLSSCQSNCIVPSWDCDGQGNCYDPGTGNGQYTSLL